jgi:hypothetical protein
MSTQSMRSFAAVQLERQPELRHEAAGSSIFDVLKNRPHSSRVPISRAC